MAFVRCRVLVLILMFLPVAASAQRATTGTITGKAVDTSGAVLPGVTITITSPEALGTFTAVTDPAGTYRVANLPPATYQVKAELAGFQTVSRDATVRLNAVVDLDFTLAIGSVAENVTVTAQASIVDPERAGLSINIDNKALTSIPTTVNRQFQDVWLMVPDPGGAGQAGERRTSIDGVDVTDPNNGDFNSVNLNYDAIQDVEVKALGAEASDGTSMVGQFLNVVTKSGGNEVRGSFAFAYIPRRFNDSNVTGVRPNQRENVQPDATLGGPIQRNRIWYFGAYRRLQENVTQNNAPVPAQNRGNLWFAKGTAQLNTSHRLQVSFQWDRAVQANGVIRSTVNPSSTVGVTGVLGSSTAGLSGATPQLADPSAFGSLAKGGPLVGFSYNWVMSSTRFFQFVGSWMSKVSDLRPNDGAPIATTRLIQTNAAGNIAGNLTTISETGSFGGESLSRRTMIYFSPSLTFLVNRIGSHEFRVGADLYPHTQKRDTLNVGPVEFYFRPPGTNGEADVLFEKDASRNYDGTGSTANNHVYNQYYGTYFQDRWKPTSHISIKAGVRVEYTALNTEGRQQLLGALLPAELPTNTADREFSQWVAFPNFGIAFDLGRAGVVRGTMSRQYEWADLGGQDGISHAPYVLATDVVRSNPRTLAPVLNQTLTGSLPLGVNYGPSKDDSDGPGRAHGNEFSSGWEHQLPKSSSLSAVFLWRRTWDVKTSFDRNVIRDPTTGQFLGRVFPAFDAINQIVTRQLQWFENRSLQFLYTKGFGSQWGVNGSYWYVITTSARTQWNPTTDTLQFLGISPADVLSERATGRHRARLSTFVKLPADVTASVFYSYTQGNRSNVMTGSFPLNAVAPTVILSNGRVVSDPFFNPAFPRARRNDVDMIKADDTHVVNLRLEKSVALPQGRKVSVSADIFNLFNAAAAGAFLSNDVRSANFAVPSGFQAARVGQLAVRLVF